MKLVLISIRPKWCEKILSGEKAIEARRTVPKVVPFKVFIYCTKSKPFLNRIDDDDNFELTNKLCLNEDVYVKDYNAQNGKVIGEFTCDKVYEWNYNKSPFSAGFDFAYLIRYNELRRCAFEYKDLINYGNGKTLYGWHISDLKIYDKPRELSEFCSLLKRYRNAGGKWVVGGLSKLKRPPQSWQYVEEVGK